MDEAFPRVLPFDRIQADAAAWLHADGRQWELSYADCACLALAAVRGFPVLTGDRKWAELPIAVEVRLIR